jgi:hypothetical protein
MGGGIWGCQYAVYAAAWNNESEERLMSSSEDILNVFTSLILQNVQQILLSKETLNHILEDHSIFGLPSIEAAIGSAVTVSATSVHQSRTNYRSVVFVDSNSTNIYGEPLRVPVKIVGNNTGFITSAYFASSKSHGIEIGGRSDEPQRISSSLQ